MKTKKIENFQSQLDSIRMVKIVGGAADPTIEPTVDPTDDPTVPVMGRPYGQLSSGMRDKRLH